MVTKKEIDHTITLVVWCVIGLYVAAAVYGFFKDVFNDHALWAIAGFISGGFISAVRAIGYLVGYY